MPPPTSSGDVEPFPVVDTASPNDDASPQSDATSSPSNKTRAVASSSISVRLRRVSESFEQSDLPEGFMAATGNIASSIVSQKFATRPRAPSAGSSSTQTQLASNENSTRRPTFPTLAEEIPHNEKDGSDPSSSPTPRPGMFVREPTAAAPFPNGYHFPPSHSFGQSTVLGLKAFWAYFLTPIGFFVTIYGLNVVAWGGMLFLLLCGAAPAMCHPTCNDINSARRKWIEVDSQILNALFCVTGFGLAPWRFRDLWFLLQYRFRKEEIALRRLGGIHRGWFRLPGSAELPADLGPENVTAYALAQSPLSIPFPEAKVPDSPLTGVRAPATPLWKLDAVIWLMVWNTLLQCVLAGFMWGMNRYDRPSWSTGLFVALGCLVAAVGGFMMFLEGKKVKGIEGVPISEEDARQLEADREQGIFHFNNIKDKDLKEKEAKKAKSEAKKEAKEAAKKLKAEKK